MDILVDLFIRNASSVLHLVLSGIKCIQIFYIQCWLNFNSSFKFKSGLKFHQWNPVACYEEIHSTLCITGDRCADERFHTAAAQSAHKECFGHLVSTVGQQSWRSVSALRCRCHETCLFLKASLFCTVSLWLCSVCCGLLLSEKQER